MRDAHPMAGTDLVVAGVRLRVVRHGPETAPPLLLLHGLPTSSYLWRDVMRDLEHSHHTIAPDLAGLGRSERPLEGRHYTLEGQALLVRALLDVLGLDRVAVAGHDLGGAVAVHLAVLAPERVGALALVDAPLHADAWPSAPALPLLLAGAGEAYVGSLRRVPRLAAAALGRALGAGLADSTLVPQELDAYLRPLLSTDGGRGLLRFTRAVDMGRVQAHWERLRGSAPPALVLWGEDDRLHSAAYGRRVAAELPGASWVPVADAGHLLPQERPERVGEELAAFLAELPAA